MKKVIGFIMFIATFIVLLTLSQCAKQDTPSFESISTEFQKSQAHVQTVADYFLTSEFKTIYIRSTDEPLFADFSYIPIDDSIKSAVSSLLEGQGYVELTKEADWNALVFTTWTDHLERECGFVYAIDNTNLPTVEFLTKLEPLSEVGWYYYVSDYNEWRNK